MAYKSYRGSKYSARKRRLLIALCALLFLVLFAVVAFFFLSDHMIFSSDGFRFDFPFMQKPPVTDPVSPDVTPPPAIDIGVTPPVTPVTPVPPVEEPVIPTNPEPPAAPQTKLLRGFLGDITAIPATLPDGFDTIALPGMTYNGKFIAKTDSAYIKGTDAAVDSADTVDAAILGLRDASANCLAIHSAFRNNFIARANRGNALTTASGAIWLDRKYIPWVNPYSDFAAEYLSDMVNSYDALGFSEVLFTDFAFPTAGKIELINYGTPALSKTQSLTAVAASMTEKLSMGINKSEMLLSVLLTDTAATALTDSASGQDIAELAKYFDKLYVSSASFDYDLTALRTALKGTSCRAGLYITDPAAPIPANADFDFIIAK